MPGLIENVIEPSELPSVFVMPFAGLIVAVGG